MKSFRAELRRRHVFRVAAWYAVAAWLVIQIATNTFPHLMFPDWTVRFVIVLCLIGFPVAIALAWALEITPEGLKVAGEGPGLIPRSAASPWRSTSLWLALAGGTLLGVGAVHAWRAIAPGTPISSAQPEIASQQASAPVPLRVLAVLPFENLGGDEGNAAFTAGMHDSLITRIAKIGGMTVISRTSVMAYEDKRPNLKDVAKALGVTHVVEGSVQRAGDRVQIQTQLIDAATDTHLWAETYDRTLAEGFATQNEIATAVANELAVRLSEQERKTLQSIPTQNAKAFEQYVLGRAEIVRAEFEKARGYFEAAVSQDPGFALAFAELSVTRTLNAWQEPAGLEVQFQQQLTSARQAYEEALTLQPELPEGILARGIFHYLGALEFEKAEPDLVAATRLLPNSFMAHTYLGGLRRRQARWEESATLLKRAAAIEPGDLTVAGVEIDVYSAMRQREDVERAIRRVEPFDTVGLWTGLNRAAVLVSFDGDLAGSVAVLERLYSQHPAVHQGQHLGDEAVAWELGVRYLSQGRFLEAAKMFESIPADLAGTQGTREMLIGWAYRNGGNEATAKRWFETSLALLNAEGLRQNWLDVAFRAVARAWALAGLGRADEAAASLREFLSMDLRAMNEVSWAYLANDSASLLAQLGDTKGALELVRELLDPPTVVLPNGLWFYWTAAPLRANPEFRELMARHGVDVTRDPVAEYAAKQASASTSE